MQSASQAPIISSNQQLPPSSLSYDGKLGDITRLWLLNLVLFFVTLSFYRFWGRTRIRQYVWKHVGVLGDRLEYTGKGKELLFGFLLTVPIFVGVVLLLELATRVVGDSVGHVSWMIFLMLGAVAVYSGMRYRVMRTSWRAIHGYMVEDSGACYMQLALFRAFANIFSLGFLKPKSDIMKWSYLISAMKLGDVYIRYKNDHKGLLGAHIWSGLASGVLGGFVAGFLIASISAVAEQRGDDLEGGKIIFFGLFAFVIAAPLFYIPRLWYVGALVRRKFTGICIGNVRTECHFGIWRYIGFQSMNLLIMLLTLGLGSAFVVHRKAKFFCRYVTLHGTPDEVTMTQIQAGKASGVTEGLMDAFGVDLAFMS